MFKGQDLSQFIKTKLAQEIQKSQIGNFIKQKGAPPITATVKKTKLGEKSKTADGIDMGQQVDAGVIPIIYGHVGMSNTQFDLGQKPSDVDAEFVTQEVRFPVSEGPIRGLAFRTLNGSRDLTGLAENSISRVVGDHTENLKQVLINDSLVIDPKTNVANFKDIKMEMTIGDGTGVFQSATISDYNPLLQEEDGDKIEAITDPTDGKLLNDLGDVTAAKGVNNVLYWNTATGRWEAKSFNSLLNEAGATYDGGAGGTGGTGGSGGGGGIGGTGGVGAGDGLGLKYTQWNPPPTHVESSSSTRVDVEVTAPPLAGTTIGSNGAPLRTRKQATPFFETTITSVDENIDKIDVTTVFPDGIYKEIITTTTSLDGDTITLCGTERPITNSGNLNCLTPSVEVSADGQTATTKTRANGSVTVNIAFTTELCGREFILHEGSYTVSETKNGKYSHTESFDLVSMNAGRSFISVEDDEQNAGSRQTGALNGSPDCNATDVESFNFKEWDLNDYLQAYPDQIVQAASTIKVYAWIDNEDADDEYTISTGVFLKSVAVCDPMNVYDSEYSVGTTNTAPYALLSPDHEYQREAFGADVETDAYDLENGRCVSNVISGTYDNTKNPDPLLVWDYTTQGQVGGVGSDGTDGVDGSTGSAGTSGSVSVPALDPVPFAEMSKDSSYSGDGVADTVILPSSVVTNENASAVNTLIISVDKGSVSVGQSGQSSSSLTLTGTAADLQTTLDSGLKFHSTTATTGDVTITHHISYDGRSSRTTRTIRPQAATEYVAPSFTIVVDDYVGTFDAYVRGKAIMNSITGATSNNATATLIAEAITDYDSIPNWTATSNLNAVTVTGPVGLGSSYNGIEPTYTGTMDATITEIAGGVSPSRISQPKQSTKQLKGKFIPALAFTNTLDADDVSFFQVKYRPEQGDGEATLSEIGLYVAGMAQMEEPNQSDGLTFEQWKSANYTSTKGWASTTGWVFFDYLTNTRYGLGNDIILNDAQKEQLYKDIFRSAQWGIHHPTGDPEIAASVFHGIFFGAESKFEALQKIADRMFAKFVYLNGNPRLIFDANSYAWTSGSYTHVPEIKKIVNQTNAADMIYQSGSIDNIFNVINVKFNNPANYFRTEEVQYRNSASIEKFGERETNIELLGCTNKQAALWHGAWMYETEASNSETVTYIAGWDHYDVLPGDLIHINDGLRVDTTTLGGRVVSDNGDGTLTLDRDAGTGSIAITDSFGVVRTGTVSGTTATISTSGQVVIGEGDDEETFTADFANDAVWNKYSGTLYGNYRVIAIEESEDGIYAVTAQKHDPDKYTRIWANTV